MGQRTATGVGLACCVVLLSGCSGDRTGAQTGDQTGESAGAGRPSTSEGRLVVPRAESPTLAVFAGSGVVLAGVHTGKGDGVFTLESRDGGRTWGREIALSAGPADQPVVGLNNRGVGAVAWTDPTGAGALLVRVRDVKGTWSSAHRIRGATTYGPPPVLVNRRGDVAVGYADQDGRQRVAVLRAGGRWSSSTVPGDTLSSLALDDSGVVHAAVVQVAHGGNGTLSTTRLGLDGSWSPLARVDAGTDEVEDVQLQVDAEGRETLAVGYVGRWVSTLDTDAYFSTAHKVLRQPRPGGPYAQVWDRDGATTLRLTRVGPVVQATWEQWERPDGRRTPHPRRSALLTQQLSPVTGAPARLDTRPVTVGDQGFARYDFATAVEGTDRADRRTTVLWRSWRPEADAPDATRQVVVGPGRLRSRLLAGTVVPAARADDLAPGQLAVSGGRTLFAVVTRRGSEPTAVEVQRR